MSTRLTRKEKELLSRAARFVLAGEWPFEEGTDEQQNAERGALERAADKLDGVS